MPFLAIDYMTSLWSVVDRAELVRVDREGGGSGADTGGRAAPDVAVALEGGDGGGAGGVGDRAFPEPSIGPTTY
jgi:hypothetical protein